MSEQNNSVADAALAALKALQKEIQETVLDSRESVDEYRIRFLSRKQGQVTALLKRIPEVAAEHRKQFGQEINAAKSLVESRIEQASSSFSGDATSGPELDFTLPGREVAEGSLHPITHALRLITKVFESYGFAVAEGPEAEDDWHNFSALNFPPDHPARDMQDTFFIEPPESDHGGILLRTHTSGVQIRVMENQKPPIRVIAPGRVYRNEAISYKSYCLFHQVEGLYVDEGVTMADLKQIIHAFARTLFGEDVKMRFRPSFFPFTEPSAEVDIWWKDDALHDGGRWMEIMGCGMVDPNVLEGVGIDSEKYTGYAFGMGIERIAMLRYGIDDIRILYENDIRFLEQFS
ncbi:MAG: phenylalanine--tRNA ligase subunit alpha [Bacteroidetes Order II. Incertae sedis bacterium]|jgi:phenylalanyl-tRNA synthetase alpha chain|nr:phenylalanine--tRNA ligase subunit alpha [Bacteroidetes Order II. bacterium]MBT4601779.1 phenylalanine--tRNA ligase subunit alpha [Bacteroidetes Order II. bacterium]MBT5250100.1 phenylalanine--tRNA ligase subunit alpha [Bacteroidetes Order II. bacterium]MBT6599088.1 phenylalanine--tRNA ligase subunit alpha [Bacteroidetes Order II. bacterium]